MKNFILAWIKKYFLEIGIFLCFVLPPVGITILLFTGWYSLHHVCKEGKKITLSPGLFLIICMFVSSIGAAAMMDNYSFFLVSALLLAYFGLYVRIKNEGVQKIFSAFKWITIFGGLYFYSLYPFQQTIMNHKVMSYFTGTALLGVSNVHDYQRLIGAGYNPNFSVAVLLFGLSFLLSDCVKNLRKAAYYKLGVKIAIVGLFIHAIILTGSKAGFASMFVIFLLFIFRFNKLWAMLLAFMMGLNMQLILNWMPRSEQLFESAGLRKEIWKHSFYIWQKHSLFGTTPLGFKKEYYHYFYEKIPHAHNILLGIFTEYGALGGIAFLIVVVINGYKVFSLYFSKQENKVYLDVFLFSLPVIILTGVFDYVLYSPQVALMAIILMACWDKYTERLTLLNPRMVDALKQQISTLFKTSKNKSHSKL